VRIVITALAIFGLLRGANGAVVTKDAATSGAIHANGDTGNGTDNEFYASGNDDNFAEYGIVGFSYTAADFGLGTVTEADITGVSLALTVNDRTFSDGNAIEFFFSPDTFASLGDGGSYSNLTYNAALFNGLDASQFPTAPISLGVYSMTEMAGRAGGEVDNFNLNFSGASLTGLVASINAGTDFQIIGAATDASHDITYSGIGSTFDPGDPALSINAVPEPSTFSLIALGLGGAFLRRRRA